MTLGNSERDISISFKHPDLSSFPNQDSLRYVVALPGGTEPTEIQDFDYKDHSAQEVIEQPIVEGVVEKLDNEDTYDLEAYSTTVTAGQAPPAGTEKVPFKVIVDSIPPIVQ